MVIFHSYAKLPEGIPWYTPYIPIVFPAKRMANPERRYPFHSSAEKKTLNVPQTIGNWDAQSILRGDGYTINLSFTVPIGAEKMGGTAPS